MIVNSDLSHFLNLIHKDMSGSDKFLDKYGWNSHIGLSYAHFNLKLADDVISYIYYFLEHRNLFFISYHTHFSAFEEKISTVPSVDIEINLGAYLLK